MTVYVDDAFIPYRNMKMCHMVADTTEELLAMADMIGVQRKWIQKKGFADEHFDVAASKRQIAINLGAVPISYRNMGRFTLARRSDIDWTPDQDPEIFNVLWRELRGV